MLKKLWIVLLFWGLGFSPLGFSADSESASSAVSGVLKIDWQSFDQYLSSTFPEFKAEVRAVLTALSKWHIDQIRNGVSGAEMLSVIETLDSNFVIDLLPPKMKASEDCAEVAKVALDFYRASVVIRAESSESRAASSSPTPPTKPAWLEPAFKSRRGLPPTVRVIASIPKPPPAVAPKPREERRPRAPTTQPTPAGTGNGSGESVREVPQVEVVPSPIEPVQVEPNPVPPATAAPTPAPKPAPTVRAVAPKAPSPEPTEEEVRMLEAKIRAAALGEAVEGPPVVANGILTEGEGYIEWADHLMRWVQPDGRWAYGFVYLDADGKTMVLRVTSERPLPISNLAVDGVEPVLEPAGLEEAQRSVTSIGFTAEIFRDLAHQAYQTVRNREQEAREAEMQRGMLEGSRPRPGK